MASSVLHRVATTGRAGDAPLMERGGGMLCIPIALLPRRLAASFRRRRESEVWIRPRPPVHLNDGLQVDGTPSLVHITRAMRQLREQVRSPIDADFVPRLLRVSRRVPNSLNLRKRDAQRAKVPTRHGNR